MDPVSYRVRPAPHSAARGGPVAGARRALLARALQPARGAPRAPGALPPGLDRESFLEAIKGHNLNATSIVLRYAR